MSNLAFKNIVGSRIESAKYNKDAESWFLLFVNGDSLNIECMWRLLEDGLISSTNNDHGHLFGRESPFNGEAALNEMAAHEILSTRCADGTGDLEFKLGQNFTLQVLADSAGYESWQYKQKNGRSFVAVSGQVHGY
jgi:hypothetical protein